MNNAAINGNSSSGETLAVIVVPVKLHPDSELAQVADALNALSGHFAAGEGWKQQCGQNSDDGNHDEQFNQGERASEPSMNGGMVPLTPALSPSDGERESISPTPRPKSGTTSQPV